LGIGIGAKSERSPLGGEGLILETGGGDANEGSGGGLNKKTRTGGELVKKGKGWP